jgi:hypothetical protein
MSHRIDQLIRLCTARIEVHTTLELPYWAERDADKQAIIQAEIDEAQAFKGALERAQGEIDIPLQDGEEIFAYLRRWWNVGCPTTAPDP